MRLSLNIELPPRRSPRQSAQPYARKWIDTRACGARLSVGNWRCIPGSQSGFHGHRRSSMSVRVVRELLASKDQHLFTVLPEATVQEALEIMASKHISSLPVTRG